MNKKHTLFATFFIAAFCLSAFSQALLKRTTYKTDRFDFGAGGTVSITGAPNGSIRVEGWQNNEIEISAEIQIEAPTTADLDRLAKVTTFLLQERVGSTGITSAGAHDRKYLKRIDKKFPKALLSMPFRIDYVVKVPRYSDLQIDGGKGDLNISGVEGMMKINYLETDAAINLVGGAITATFGIGEADIIIPSASWRGRFADIQLASGKMNVKLPPNLNAEFDAVILRTGKIENEYTFFKPRIRKAEFTEKLIEAKSGVGGIKLKFTVGDGSLKISENKK